MRNEFMIAHDFSLKPYNSMRIDAEAETIYMPYTTKGVIELFEKCSDYGFQIIGNGSNIIFAKKKYASPIVLTHLLNRLSFEGDSIVAQCGVSLSALSWFALEKSVSGYEYLEDIPGSVGGALFMNAGTYENCIGDQVHTVTVYDFTEKKVMELSGHDLRSYWGRRNSYFQHHHTFIIECALDTKAKGDYLKILETMLEIKKKRYAKQPREYPSAGSVFKRPYIHGEPRYIWQLMDEAGLRGYRIGDAQVSEKHPGFIVNVGEATGKDVVALMNYCKDTIKKKFDITINEEWEILS